MTKKEKFTDRRPIYEEEASCDSSYNLICEIDRLTRLNKVNEEAYKILFRYFHDCKNELCQKCGNYLEAHLGKCDNCRWYENNKNNYENEMKKDADKLKNG